MEPGMRSGGSGLVVKNRNSSGCLIVKKKGGGSSATAGVGSSNSRKLYESLNRPNINNMPFSDSESSGGELPLPPVRHVRRPGPDTIRVSNDMIGRSQVISKRGRMEQVRGNEEGMLPENGFDRRERKRGKFDPCDFGEHADMDVERMGRGRFDDNEVGFGGGRFMAHSARGGVDREFESGSSRHIVDKRRSPYYDRPSGLYAGDNNSYYDRPSGLYPGDNVDHSRFKMNRDGTRLPQPVMREKFNSDNKTIRIQGKNGVLKVMVNRRKVGGPLEHYDLYKHVDSRQMLKTEGTAKRNILSHPSPYLEAKPVEKPGLLVKPEKKQIASRKPLSSKYTKRDEWDSDNSDTSLNPGMVKADAHKRAKRIISGDEQTPVHENIPTTTTKEGKLKRGNGTEKQKLREKIREMLLNAGWTIDYRPRRNRDYLDAVYINSTGTAYWSIIKAYEALQKQLSDGVVEAKPKGDSSSFAPIADDLLSQLTRKTRKKMQKELKMKNKKKYDRKSDSEKEPHIRRSSGNKLDMNSTDSDSNEEKLSSFMKQQGSKSMKNKLIENATVSASSKSQDATHHSNDGMKKSFAGCNPHLLNGQQSTKDGRCTLLVCSSNEGLNSEPGGFVPYAGKRTVLSWLIDSGTVELRKKVQYRRRKRVLLEGWITRDGIHCGCCSKILTVSKFELHAGSKLRQPYQNIFLESGASLLQCQIDAWNKQDDSGKIGFSSVDTDGDDTCGKCGDGGDLICCDGCPSTFHQSCLDIQMLPPGEWHCPNCTCKFCGISCGASKKEVDTTVDAVHTCNLCEKKYHSFCATEMDALPDNFITPGLSFCGKECKELFEHLKKYLGTKNELEEGFSWSLIHRTDGDSDVGITGITQRVECNSKLAIALTVMDECFLPVIDRRSGVNLIHNVLYNSRSNFSRLNYSGFYTAILERGDEIISAASIRFHGTKLAEMPLIGTRQIYRRQGMCRRLFSAIELVLCSLKVEKLVVPAITGLMHTWTTVFGFTHLEESLRKEMKSLNMLVFPGLDMLQKLLVEQGKHESNTTAAGLEKMGNRDNVFIKAKMSNRSDMDPSALHDPHGSDDASSDPANEMDDEYSDASEELNNQVLVDRTLSPKPHSEKRLPDSVSDKCASPNTSDGAPEMNNKIVMALSVHELNPSSKCQSISLNDTSVSSDPLGVPKCHEVQALVQETACSDPSSVEILDRKCHSFSGMNCDSSELDINRVLDPQVADNNQPSEVSVHTLNPSFKCQSISLNDTSVSSDPLGVPKCHEAQALVQETACSGPTSVQVLDRKCHSFTGMNCDSSELDIKQVLDSQVADNNQPSNSLNDTSVSSDPLDVPKCHEGQALVQETACSAPSSVEILDKECNPFTGMNCDSSELDINQVLDSQVGDNNQPSNSLNDTSVSNDPLDVPKCHEVQALVQEMTCSGPRSVEILDKKCHSFNGMNCGTSELDINRVLDSQVADHNQPSKYVSMTDADEVLEAVPSGNRSEENITQENDHNVNSSEDNNQPSKDVSMTDAHEVLEAVPSGNRSEENITKENNHNVDSSELYINRVLDSQVADNNQPSKGVSMTDLHEALQCSGHSSEENIKEENNHNVDSSELDITRVLDSQVPDNNQPSKDVSLTDAYYVLEVVPSGNRSKENIKVENNHNVDSSELDINQVLDSQVADNNQPSKDISMTDAHYVLEAVSPGNRYGENIKEENNHNIDSSELEINRVLVSQVADNNQPSEDVSMNDAHDVLEAVPSGNRSEENVKKENNHNMDFSDSDIKRV